MFWLKIDRWSLSICFIIMQNWKLRWFVLKKDEIRYYAQRASPEPIRTMDLRECQDCIRYADAEEDCSFSYVVVTLLYYSVIYVISHAHACTHTHTHTPVDTLCYLILLCNCILVS